MRFRITTLGCKVNQYEAAALAEALERAGLEASCRDDPSIDLLVVHTCCVTATAMAKSRQAIARAVRGAPHAAVWITGCYVDYDGRRIAQRLASLGVPPETSVLTGHHDDLSARIAQVKAMLASPGPGRASVGSHRQEQHAFVKGGSTGMLSAAACYSPASTPSSIKARRQEAVKQKLPATASLPSLRRFPGRQRAIVKVQDGCDAFCSYCIVPYVRCRLGSRPAETLERECRDLLAAGHREIVLCGVFLGAYGRDTTDRRRWGDDPSQLPRLIRRIAGLEGLWRLRLSSLECLDVTEEFLAVCRESPTVALHFHLPLQSGSDRVLERMNRRYTARQFLQAVARLNDVLDRPAITTDILVGFPGEDEADFAATLTVARQARFAKIHAFPFSPIEGTAAWAFRHESPAPNVVKARMAELAALEGELAAAYRRQFIGQTVEALVEGQGPPSPMYGAWEPRRGRSERFVARTDRYFTVELTGEGFQPGQVVLATIEGQDGKRLVARPVNVLIDARCEKQSSPVESRP